MKPTKLTESLANLIVYPIRRLSPAKNDKFANYMRDVVATMPVYMARDPQLSITYKDEAGS